jgi:hypothetical protein
MEMAPLEWDKPETVNFGYTGGGGVEPEAAIRA